jgi:hypothetical protein
MPTIPLTGPLATTLDGSELIPLWKDNSTQHASIQALSALFGGGGGTVWLNGVSAPTAGQGTNGNYYLNTTSGDISFKTGSTWSVIGNIKGAPGSTWFTSTGVPLAASGANNDFDLVSNGDVYKKVSGAWVLQFNIRGPTGTAGNPGGTSGQLQVNSAGGFGGVTISGDATVDPSGVLTLGTVPATKGGTGLTSGNSGGVLFHSATTAIQSSPALTARYVMLGGGPTQPPRTVASPGNTGDVLTSGGTNNDPTWAAPTGGTGGGVVAPVAGNTVTTMLDTDPIQIWTGGLAKWITRDNFQQYQLISAYQPTASGAINDTGLMVIDVDGTGARKVTLAQLKTYFTAGLSTGGGGGGGGGGTGSSNAVGNPNLPALPNFATSGHTQWFRMHSNVPSGQFYSDLGMTSAATTAGANVRAIKDQTLQGHDFNIGSTATGNALQLSQLNGKAALVVQSFGGGFQMAQATSDTLRAFSNITIFGVIRATALATSTGVGYSVLIGGANDVIDACIYSSAVGAATADIVHGGTSTGTRNSANSDLFDGPFVGAWQLTPTPANMINAYYSFVMRTTGANGGLQKLDVRMQFGANASMPLSRTFSNTTPYIGSPWNITLGQGLGQEIYEYVIWGGTSQLSDADTTALLAYGTSQFTI